MVTYASSSVAIDFEEFEESEQMEKIVSHRGRSMPSRRSISAKRAMHRTPASRRASRKVSAQVGGQHKRRSRHPQH